MFENMLNETLKVNEEEIKAMGQIKYEEKPVEGAPQAAQENAEADAAQETVDITPELVDGLINKIPELEGIDAGELLAGMVVEMEHVKAVGNNIEMVAKIAADHIKEFPGKDYYGALVAMEDGLKAVEEPVKEEPSEKEEPGEGDSGESESEEDSEEEEDDEDYEEDENDTIEEAKTKKEKRDAKKAKKDAKKAKADAKAKKDKKEKK